MEVATEPEKGTTNLSVSDSLGHERLEAVRESCYSAEKRPRPKWLP